MSEKDDLVTGESIRGVSAVEIKFTVRPDQELTAVRALDLDFDTAQQRRIYFMDSPELELYNRGLILRARAVEGDDDDSTVKIRPVEPDAIGKDWRSIDGFKVEADIVGDKVVRSASLSVPQGQGEVSDVVKGDRPIEKLFSGDQERFAQTHGAGAPDYSLLRVLGPVEVLRWEIMHKQLPYELTVEEWRLPDGADLLEISIKVAPDEEDKATAGFQAFIRGLKLDLEGAQQTKTRVALEYFASQL